MASWADDAIPDPDPSAEHHMRVEFVGLPAPSPERHSPERLSSDHLAGTGGECMTGAVRSRP